MRVLWTMVLALTILVAVATAAWGKTHHQAPPAKSTCPPAPAPCGYEDGPSEGANSALIQALTWVHWQNVAQYVAQTLTSIMHDHWLRVGRCEQPGGGYGGIDWSAHGSTSDGYFEGGLGIAASLYRSIAGHSALQDGPLEQMAVATVAYQQVGSGAWECK